MEEQLRLSSDSQAEPQELSGLEVMAEAERLAELGLTRGRELVSPAEAHKDMTQQEMDQQRRLNQAGLASARAALAATQQR